MVRASLPTLAFVSLGVAVAGVACAGGEKRPTPADPGSTAQRTQSINVTGYYNDTCGKCHGDQAQGGGGGTKTLATKDKFDQKWDKAFFNAIKNGVPDAGMEAYGATLNDAAVWSMVVHIRELQSKALRQQFGSPKAVNGVYSSQHHKYKLETIVEAGKGLQTPWAIDWLPDGTMLVTSRPGTLHVVKGYNVVGKVEGIPAVAEIGQGGLMDVTVHPDYAKNGFIYLGYTEPAPAGRTGGMTKIVRGKVKWNGNNGQWTDQQTIFECAPETYSNSGVHYGNRIVFDGKGHVFFSIGERGSGNLAQDLTKPNGKVYRLNEDGTVPADNPFADPTSKSKGFIGAVWSYGHRNPQGLAFGIDGSLWDTEHAPRGGDEVNRVVKAANYGWPLVSFGINYNDTPNVPPYPTTAQNFTMPVFRWLPSTGACGLDVYRKGPFTKWTGDLIAGGLSGMNVDRIKIKGDQVIEREELIQGIARVRETVVGPDGFIYVAFNQPDKIVRLVPAN